MNLLCCYADCIGFIHYRAFHFLLAFKVNCTHVGREEYDRVRMQEDSPLARHYLYIKKSE